jgi:hypothetical protein
MPSIRKTAPTCAIVIENLLTTTAKADMTCISTTTPPTRLNDAKYRCSGQLWHKPEQGFSRNLDFDWEG